MSLDFVKSRFTKYVIHFTDNKKSEAKIIPADFETVITNVNDEIDVKFRILILDDDIEQLNVEQTITYGRDSISVKGKSVEIHTKTNTDIKDENNSIKTVRINTRNSINSMTSTYNIAYINDIIIITNSQLTRTDTLKNPDQHAAWYLISLVVSIDEFTVNLSGKMYFNIVDFKPVITHMRIASTEVTKMKSSK